MFRSIPYTMLGLILASSLPASVPGTTSDVESSNSTEIASPTTPSGTNQKAALVTLLHFSDPKYAYSAPMDWSPDGNVILIQFSIYNETTQTNKLGLALTDPELSYVRELAIPFHRAPEDPISNETAVFVDQPISRALFSSSFADSPTNVMQNNRDRTRDIFFLWKEELYQYDVDSGELQKIMDGIVFFDVTTFPNTIAYSQYDGGRNSGLIGLFDMISGSSRTILQEVPGLYTFDLSPDGKQILFGNQYYDLDTGKTMQIPEMYSIGSLPKWTATTSMDNRFVVYAEASKGGKVLVSGAIYVTSLDKQAKEVLVASSADIPEHFVISPSSKSLLVSSHGIRMNGTLSSIGKADMYRLDFAEPIPEFNSTVLFIMIASIIGGILLMSRFGNYKLRIHNL
jgi:hypothetical protein